jgi:hypothetical protein
VSDSLWVRCCHCGFADHLGDKGKLSHAHAYHLPIFPQRCHQCGMRFTERSVEYLREFALHFMVTSRDPKDAGPIEVRMVPHSSTGPLR